MQRVGCRPPVGFKSRQALRPKKKRRASRVSASFPSGGEGGITRPLGLAPTGPPPAAAFCGPAPPGLVEPNGSHQTARHPQIRPGPRVGPWSYLAEREGFEPPDGCPSTVFKTAAFDHSATSPVNCVPHHTVFHSCNGPGFSEAWRCCGLNICMGWWNARRLPERAANTHSSYVH